MGPLLADCNYSNEKKLLTKNSKILDLTLFSWTFTSEVSAFKENLGEVAEILRLNFLDILRRQRRRLTSLFQNKPWQRRALIRQPTPRRGLGPRTPSDHWTLRCLLSKFLFNSHFRCWWADLNASFLSRFQNNPRLMKENTVPESNCFTIFVENRFSQFHCTSSQASKLSCSRSVKSESYQQGTRGWIPCFARCATAVEREALSLDAGFLLPRELKTALIPEVLILVSPLLIMGRWEQGC